MDGQSAGGRMSDSMIVSNSAGDFFDQLGEQR
jgi:hypothetical protein